MNKIRLSKSVIGSKEKEAVMKVLDKEYLGMGSEVKVFEDKISEYIGRTAVCVATGTAALHLAIESLGLGAGDEILVPSLTYVASFQAISAAGAVPIACDIEPTYLSIDPEDAESRITVRTKAIMVVHYTGQVGDFDKILKLARKYKLRVIEDAAHAFGSTYQGKRIGSFGDVTCFSFDGIKNITSGEGGAIVTDDELVFSRARDGRLLGVERDTDARYSGKRSWEFDVVRQGWRFHMSNIMAAIGIVQLARFDELAEKRQSLGARYLQKLRGSEELVVPVCKDFSNSVPHIFVVKILASIDRDLVRTAMSASGIDTGIHYQPNHNLSFYKQAKQKPFPVVDEIYPQLLTLPMHPDLSYEDIDRIVKCLLDALN